MSLLQAFFVSSPAVLRLPQAVRAVCMSVPSYLLTFNNMEHLKTRFMVLAFLLLWASGAGLCAQDVWDGSVADEFAGGSGTGSAGSGAGCCGRRAGGAAAGQAQCGYDSGCGGSLQEAAAGDHVHGFHSGCSFPGTGGPKIKPAPPAERVK